MMKCADCNKMPCRPLAYICCGGSAKVAIIDLESACHIGDIFCGDGSDPYYIVISPDKKIAYVGDYMRKMVLKLDLVCHQLVCQVPVAGNPRGIDISPDGQIVYVVFNDVPTMQMLGADLQDIGQIPLPTSGGSVSIVNNGLQAYVTQPDLNQTAVADLSSCSVIKLLDTGVNPGRMAYSAQDSLLLVAGRGSRTLTPIDTCRICTGEDIALTGTPAGLAFTEGKQQCLVALANENKAVLVDLCTRQVTDYIPVGQLPGGVGASECYPLSVVSSQISSTAAIINTKTGAVTATLNVGSDPVGTAVIC